MATLDIGGQKITVGDEFLSLSPEQQNATVEEIAASIPSVGGLAKQTAVGVGKGVIGGFGMLGGVRELAGVGTEMLGLGPDVGKAAVAGIPAIGPLSRIAPTPQDIQRQVEKVTGPFREAKNRPERYGESIGEMASGAVLGPGSGVRAIAAKLGKYAVPPGVLSEAAGEATRGTSAEPVAKVAGAITGTVLGAGAGKAVTGVQNFAAGRSAAKDVAGVLGGDTPIPAGAVRRAEESMAADKITPTTAAAVAQQLGPDDTMVMDLGRQMRGRAEAIAAQPGRGQNAVLDAVEGRTGRFGQGTADRVEQTLNREMGPTHNVVELVDRVNEAVDRIASPLYKKVMEAHPILSVPADIAQRPAVAQAMKNAVTLAKQHGEDLTTTETKSVLSGPGFHIVDETTLPAKTSLRYWDYVKKDMDRRINSYMKSGGASELNSADKADLGGLMDARRSLVEHLDGVTKGAYKEARQASATKFELREALDFGRAAFNTKLLPEEFAATMSDMSVPERAMAKAGFRRELDRIIEATRNEGATARRVLDTGHVLQKTEMLFGQQAAREIERRVAAENTFQEATQDIARNSRTAVRQQLIKDTSTPSTSAIGATTIPGMIGMAGRGGLNYIREHGMTKTRDALGDILSAKGADVDPIVRAITEYGKKRNLNALQSGAGRTAGIVNALIAGNQ